MSNKTDAITILLAIGTPLFLLFGKTTRLYNILKCWLYKTRLQFKIKSLRQKDPDASSSCVEVSGLYVYPVKSLRAVPLDVTMLNSLGLVNDRRFMIVRRNPSNPNTWRFLTQVREFYNTLLIPFLMNALRIYERGCTLSSLELSYPTKVFIQ